MPSKIGTGLGALAVTLIVLALAYRALDYGPEGVIALGSVLAALGGLIAVIKGHDRNPPDG
jgi:hypothetical protein